MADPPLNLNFRLSKKFFLVENFFVEPKEMQVTIVVSDVVYSYVKSVIAFSA